MFTLGMPDQGELERKVASARTSAHSEESHPEMESRAGTFVRRNSCFLFCSVCFNISVIEQIELAALLLEGVRQRPRAQRRPSPDQAKELPSRVDVGKQKTLSKDSE